MEILQTNVWSAFRAITLYANKRPECIRTAKRINVAAPFTPALYQSTAAKCARMLHEVDKSYPIPFEPDYIAYLYLFKQWTRVSYPQAKYVPGEGWYGLTPPYFTVIGSPTSTAEMTWVNWLHANTPIKNRQDIELMFPMVPVELSEVVKKVNNQLRMVERYARTQKVSRETIVEKYDITGHIRDPFGPVTLQWHPWVQMIFNLNPEHYDQIVRLFSKKENIDAFLTIDFPKDLPLGRMFRAAFAVVQKRMDNPIKILKAIQKASRLIPEA